MPANLKRPVRIANCSGALTDPGIHMYNQAKYGPVDVITGDYLAEANMGDTAVAAASNDRPGWIATALEGLEMSLDIIHEKKIKVVVNGGCIDPRGLARKVDQMARDKNLPLKVAYVEGDDLMPKIQSLLPKLPHLDSPNADIQLDKATREFLDHPDTMPIVSANAYLGYRAIKRGLDLGADIIICGRVADASPVIAAAAWWHGWQEDQYDELAGALVGGHLIECSTYVTGGNFSGAHDYPVEAFLSLGLPIVEMDADGGCVVTKHETLGGFVTADTVKCQFLYELQGDVYLNSDVKADIKQVRVTQEAKDRVRVSGIRGRPPPPTTKLAVFYRGGFQSEILVNASGYATQHKWDVEEAQLRAALERTGVLGELDVLECQRMGVPMANPDSQLASTTYMRIFIQAKELLAVQKAVMAWYGRFMTHFPGMHCSLDMRTLQPKPFLGYWPALVEQKEIDESITLVTGNEESRQSVGPPKKTEPLGPRSSYETTSPISTENAPFTMRPLGDIALARSGDKGANINLGIFVQTRPQWDWLRSFMTRDRLRTMMGKDWRDWYWIERVEFPDIFAVHFVVYGILGRGVSSTSRVDCLGKGFAEFIRAVHVPVPDDLPLASARL
ncbi:uncharacterized protein F5Z01DRAFT_619685 [Emericellopsis atlantica]|uniref:DUF1446 domain-containing protein n=1 Tax=Emericellopsis atlantica TaxID=2614577 RepID=A0A9P8CSA2_9HYPO|nr:uncharacterized protein F5Z01DRAFT_619685 [Emericellopsis atlantica]KAG9255541.1 hypothetical protein F5Z01DRAFT_619685 [Emericellopsis atlantica]